MLVLPFRIGLVAAGRRTTNPCPERTGIEAGEGWQTLVAG
jgi:hypothetical protein